MGKEKEETILTMMSDTTAGNILDRLSDIENHPEGALVPYREFSMDNETYYFTPGGFLYRKDPGTEEVGGFFCGYLTDEAWHYWTDDGQQRTQSRSVDMTGYSFQADYSVCLRYYRLQRNGRCGIVYRNLDPPEVLIEVIGDMEEAKVRLSLAEAKMRRSGLAHKAEHEEITRFN